MKKGNDKILSHVLLILYFLSVLSLVIPFKIYKEVYLNSPVTNVYFVGLLVVGGFFALTGIVWKGIGIIRYEMICLSLWSFLLSIWYRFKIETGLPLFFMGIVMLFVLLNIMRKDSSGSNKPWN